MFAKPESSSVLFRWLLMAMVLGGLLSLGRSVMKEFGPTGGIDFHSYWYYGHFVRQGDNPYAAFVAHQELQVPIQYLDGVTTEKLPVAQPGLAATPANTAPIVLLLSGFSWLSWPTAKTLWFLINLVIAFCLPWLILRLLPEATLKRTQGVFICLAFYIFSGTRVAVWTGQTTLLVFLLMVGALLLLNKHRLVAGILLGFALSKYSLALPIFLFVLYQRKYWVAAISLIVQALGLLMVAYLGHESPFLVLNEYFLIFGEHASLQGENCETCIHLSNLLPQTNMLIDLSIAIGVIIITFGGLWMGLAQILKPSNSASLSRFIEFHILTIFALLSLLVAYHRVYDIVIAIVFVVLLVWGLAKPGNWNIAEATRTGIIIFLGLFMTIMVLPGEIGELILPRQFVATWLQIFNISMTLGLVFALGVSLSLLRKVR
ncbi:hypothetical protein BH10CHL1_BH10CHL1_09180 [soil metagenome]